MEKVKETLDISKGGGMQGIGVDQTALMENEDFKRQATESESSQLEKESSINKKELGSQGGSSLAQKSKVPHHSSELLNKLDPRIGYTPEEADAAEDRYNAKYGTVREGYLEERGGTGPAGGSMSGIGADQTALGDMGTGREAAGIDAEGHN